MAPLVRELVEDGVQVNVTALFTTAQVELITEAVRGRRAELRLGLRRADRRRRRRSAADHGRARSRSCADAPRAELIWASPREVLNVVQADQVGCHIITMTHDLLPKLELARQGPRAVLARDRPDVPPRRDRGRLHALAAVRRALITGGAGFIGSTLADRLLRATASRSSILDDFRTGRREFVAGALGARRASWSRATCSTRRCSSDAIAGCDTVFHLQANADVRHGLEHPRRDLEQNTIATVERARGDARARRRRRSRFSSTGSVYGEPEVFPTPEDAPFPVQTSLYARVQARGRGDDRRLRRTASASPG